MLVETVCSAISPGSEMLVYRGQFPKNLVDSNDSLSSELQYPVAYGYACVGRVVKISKEMRRRWLGRLVFAFQPHTSHFLATPDELIPLPDGMSPEMACFLPNMETAVNFVQDSAPILGEQVLVFGQGIVGLLTTVLLMEFPLASLVTCDCYPLTKGSLSVPGRFRCTRPEHVRFSRASPQTAPIRYRPVPGTLRLPPCPGRCHRVNRLRRACCGRFLVWGEERLISIWAGPSIAAVSS